MATILRIISFQERIWYEVFTDSSVLKHILHHIIIPKCSSPINLQFFSVKVIFLQHIGSISRFSYILQYLYLVNFDNTKSWKASQQFQK